jgi:mono/diheme cytochrome c family protein
MQNPLEASKATINRGAGVYAANCTSCHGSLGEGDGTAGRSFAPLPADLAWLSQMKISRSDGFMYWTIAEGGVPFGTAMPPFKDRLPGEDIWAVTSFIQAHLQRAR